MLSRIKKFLRKRHNKSSRPAVHSHPVILTYTGDINHVGDRTHEGAYHNVHLEKSTPRIAIQDVFGQIDSEERQRSTERAAQLIEEERRQRKQLPSYAGLEQYEIVKKLGDGAFSNVYMARDKTNGQNVAIKVVRKREYEKSKEHTHLHPSMKRRPKAIERANILKEVQIMRNVEHPNIVRLVEFIESQQHYFLVLEFCEGGELFHQIIKLTYFSEVLARHVITQVAHAVRYLHEECGVVHRDIKPENILFEPIPYIPVCSKTRVCSDKEANEGLFTADIGGGGIGRVKLADFGLSKVIWDNSTWTPCGTVGYTAPEIVRDQRYSKSVDMWALGCVLYTLLCGFPPFYDESISSLTDKVAHGHYAFLSPWWDPVSDAAKDLITRLLCVDPARRYTITQFLNHPWVTEEESVAHPSTHILQLFRTFPTATVSGGISDFDLAEEGGRGQDGRKDAFSPGVPSIKEILDVTYAVQRMGEEQTWRGAFVDNPNADPRYYYTQDDDDGDDIFFAESAEAIINNNKHRHRSAEQQYPDPFIPVTPSPPTPSHYHGYRAQRVKQAKLNKSQKMSFHLNIDNATLLKNRRQQAAF